MENESDNEPNIVESLVDQLREYGKTRTDLWKLKTVEKTSELLSTVCATAASWLIASRAILFLGIAGGFLLGEWIGKYSYGFFIISFLFILASILVYRYRDKLVKDPIARVVIMKMME